MIPNRHNFPSKFFYSSIFIAISIIFSQNSQPSEYNLNYHPTSYILNKLKTHDIVFLGTRHKQPGILNFISKLITALHNSGVTHIGLEIVSDEQTKINKFIKTDTGLSDIQIHQQIDCHEYRNLFPVLRNLDPNQRPVPVALDLPKSKYNESISRDEWMAKSIAKIFQKNSKAKMLIILGNNHILKKLGMAGSCAQPAQFYPGIFI